MFIASTTVLLGALALSLTGCTRQAEGDRCSLDNGNDDCDGSLVCTASSGLRDGDDGVDRCCPKAGDGTVDQKCTIFLGSGTEQNTGQGGSNAQTEEGDSTVEEVESVNSGDTCSFNSDCVEPLVCGPQGACQVECQSDRDCPDGQSCVGENGAQRCE